MADTRVINLAIVGAGGMGQRWAQAIGVTPDAKLSLVVDTDEGKACLLAARYSARFSSSLKEILKFPDIDAVLVLTTHNQLADVAREALSMGKHVLVEKPAARSADEFKPVVELAAQKNLRLMVGYSARFHAHIQKAKELIDAGKIGTILFIRAAHGFGGRMGYEHEWRHKKEISGGGELLDQGVHLIDIARWFLGDISDVKGSVAHSFWKSEVEDNAYAIMQTKNGATAVIHASWTQWKPIFSLEIMGSEGYIELSGLGKKYGAQEQLTFAERRKDFSDPKGDEHTEQFDGGVERAFAAELAEFISAIRQGRAPCPSGQDGLAVLDIVSKIYGRL